MLGVKLFHSPTEYPFPDQPRHRRPAQLDLHVEYYALGTAQIPDSSPNGYVSSRRTARTVPAHFRRKTSLRFSGATFSVVVRLPYANGYSPIPSVPKKREAGALPPKMCLTGLDPVCRPILLPFSL